ncbi:MAG TPA: DUF2283 domain-containing protein [Gemmataceae bacterium]|nr:DUF2283 domain-containing protein [Gemmataceae bacterium]
MAEVTEFKPKDALKYLKAVMHLVRLPVSKLWIDYDEEADLLYISFRRPQRATDSELRDDGIIVRKRGKQVVGLTILDASTC